jgi:hypothetical protein
MCPSCTAMALSPDGYARSTGLQYVDNFFLFHPRGSDWAAREAKVSKLLKALGVPLHELQSNVTLLKGLGWMWDLQRMRMICPLDKFTILCKELVRWASANSLSLLDIERACGVLLWLSAGFQIGRGEIAFLYAIRKAGKALHLRKGNRCSKRSIICPLSAGAREALRFWAVFFPVWDRECPIVQGFGPSASWQWRGQVDASTDWGCGGVIFSPDSSAPIMAFCHKWSEDERESAGPLSARPYLQVCLKC